MKALSVKQPWASLIVGWTDDAGEWWPGPKGIENRSQKPPAALIGRRIAIHASKREDDEVGASIRSARHIFNPGTSDITAHGPSYVGRTTELPLGAIVGVATIAGIVTSHAQLRVVSNNGVVRFGDDDEDWYIGAPNVGILLLDRRAIVPISDVKGALGYWTLPADVEQQIAEQLR